MRLPRRARLRNDRCSHRRDCRRFLRCLKYVACDFAAFNVQRASRARPTAIVATDFTAQPASNKSGHEPKILMSFTAER